MSSDPNAPIAPPMMSPDGKWVWDGHQWIPVADPTAQGQQAVSSPFDAASMNGPVMMASPPAAVQVQVPYSVGPAPVSARPAGQLWDRQQTGLNKYLYIGAGAVALLIVLVLVGQFAGLISLPFGTSPAANSLSPETSTPALSARSDFARADRVMKTVVTPALAGLNDTLGPLDQGCHGTLTIACSSTLAPADREIKHAIALIDAVQPTVPPCLGSNVAAIRRDLSGMDVNLGLMQTAFTKNDNGSVKGYYLRYENGHAALSTDLAAATQAEQQTCSQDIAGP
jgi:hypothetical protein